MGTIYTECRSSKLSQALSIQSEYLHSSHGALFIQSADLHSSLRHYLYRVNIFTALIGTIYTECRSSQLSQALFIQSADLHSSHGHCSYRVQIFTVLRGTTYTECRSSQLSRALFIQSADLHSFHGHYLHRMQNSAILTGTIYKESRTPQELWSGIFSSVLPCKLDGLRLYKLLQQLSQGLLLMLSQDLHRSSDSGIFFISSAV